MIERPWWQRVLYNIWPAINRIINNGLFRFAKILNSAIKMALKQIKYG